MSDLLSLNEEGLDAFGPQPRFVTNSRLTRWCIAYIKKKKRKKEKKNPQCLFRALAAN